MSSLKELITSAPGISARPDSVISLLEIIEDPVVDVQKLLPIVDHDPGLTAGLLKLCNSSLYNFKRRIGSPRDALVLVGNLTFARLCFTLSLEPVLHNDLPGYDLDLDDLWQHSLATAYGSAFLINAIGRRDLRDRAFTAGLLHDTGKLVLDHGLDEAGAGKAGAITRTVEKMATGFDHAEAGAALLQSWGVPDQVVEAVRFHHDPLQASENKRLALAVSIANEVEHFAANLSEGSSAVEKWVQKTFANSSMPQEAITILAGKLSSANKNILSLAQGPGL